MRLLKQLWFQVLVGMVAGGLLVAGMTIRVPPGDGRE